MCDYKSKEVTELLEAKAKEYGKFADTANRARIFNKIFKPYRFYYGVRIPNKYLYPLTLGAQMLSVKSARLLINPEHEDTLIDFDGYLTLILEALGDNLPVFKYIMNKWLENLGNAGSLIPEYEHFNQVLSIAIQKIKDILNKIEDVICVLQDKE